MTRDNLLSRKPFGHPISPGAALRSRIALRAAVRHVVALAVADALFDPLAYLPCQRINLEAPEGM